MSEEGVVKPVAEFVASFEGNQNCSRPSTIFPVGMDVIRNAQVPEVIKEVSVPEMAESVMERIRELLLKVL